MKRLQRILACMLAAAMAVSLAACGNNGGQSTADDSATGEATQAETSPDAGAPEETTLKIYLFGESQNSDKVLEEFYAQTADTLNIKLDIIWSSGADHKEKVPLMMSNQEDVDLVFDAFWMNLSSLAGQGAYADLSSYFNNPAYPGLQSAFDDEYLKQVTAADGTVFAIPFTQAAEDIQVIHLRKDLREKYGMDPISSADELEEYFQNVQADIDAGELDMIAPIGVDGTRAFYYLENYMFERRAANVLEITGSAFGVGLDFEVLVSEDGKTVLGANTLGDPDEMYADWPAPFNTNIRNTRITETLIKWAQYSQADAQTEDDSKNNLFFTGKVAAIEGNISGFDEISRTIESLGGEAEMFVYGDLQRAGGTMVTAERTAWNFLCVPQQSKKIDATMAFINWLFEDPANHDLFELGIEGEDWEAVGTAEYRDLENSSKYTFPGYEMTWNPNFIRTNADLPDEVKEIFIYQNDPSSYEASPLSGFSFDSEASSELRTAYAAVTGIQSTYSPILMLGLASTTAEAQEYLDEYYAQVQAAGLEVIRQAVIEQAQAHLDTFA